MSKWLKLGIGIKRWVLLLFVCIVLVTGGLSGVFLHWGSKQPIPPANNPEWLVISLVAATSGAMGMLFAFYRVSSILLTPYRQRLGGDVVDVVVAARRLAKGPRVVAIGGGTGLPSVLRGLKQVTGNITAIVTVADDGGSSGRLRRELGVLPPGDLRNNIAALADDESLMTRLFQYRFDAGDLGGHAFGNLFITALAGVTGSIEAALIETERVLNIQGRVLPATLDDVHLVGRVRLEGQPRAIQVEGESAITKAGGVIESVSLRPVTVAAYEESVRAILEAEMVVIGPGSLFTSILPNLLVPGIAEALRATRAYSVYVCNVATQAGETDGFSVADHVLALERHVGRGVFQAILANNAYPTRNAGQNTHYITSVDEHHEILQRYELRYADLTDDARPWRHDSQKLVTALLQIQREERSGISAVREAELPEV